ncbi:SpoIIE family protein phosphatase [Streptomyces sp. NPDC093970]|uniref:SpoIIE family protein phosphatase n=1 Tax=Streptomyces sp. NPDC093970 TaxID=3155076 RepID=UPI0034444944
MTAVPNDRSSAPRQPAGPAAAPAAVLLDRAGKVVGWSEGAEALLGHRGEEVLDRPVDVLLAPGERLRLPENGDWSGSLRFRHRAGHEFGAGACLCALGGAADREHRLLTLSSPGRGTLSGVNRSLLDGLLSHSPVGMAVMDTDLRYTWVNEALVRASGVADRLGRTLSAVFPSEEAAAGEVAMRRVVETGEPLIDYEYRGPILSDPAGEHMYSASFFRLEDEQGAPTGLCYLVLDVTERWHRHQRELMLGRARACGRQLDPVRAARELAEICVPGFADQVAIDLTDAVVQGDEIPRSSAHGPFRLRHAARTAVPELGPSLCQVDGQAVECGPDTPAARCLTGGVGVLGATCAGASGARVQGTRESAEAVGEPGSHSSIMVPLCAAGGALGVVTFLRAPGKGPFTERDLAFAEEFATLGSSVLAAAHRFTQERRISLSLQRNLLPGRLTEDEAVEIAWRYFPASEEAGVGGDWADAIPLSAARVALVVGDVVGHGVNATAAMGRLRAAVHTLAAMDLPPDELLAHLDDFVTRICEEQPAREGCGQGNPDLLGAIGASCLYAVYDPVARTCTMASAGHPAPVVTRPDATTFVPELPAGSLLGVGAAPFESVEIPCPGGSLLAFFTDGLVEDRRRDLDEGVAGLRSVLNRPGAPLEELCDRAVDALLPRPLEDDAALLLARTASLPSSDVETWEIPDDPAAVGEARALAGRRLDEWGLGDLRFGTELIVSELVTNGIRYGSAPIRLRLIRHKVLTCEVMDGSSTSPRLRHARTTDEGGRGLFLVAQASQRWGYRYTSTGKSIWVEQDLP